MDSSPSPFPAPHDEIYPKTLFLRAFGCGVHPNLHFQPPNPLPGAISREVLGSSSSPSPFSAPGDGIYPQTLFLSPFMEEIWATSSPCVSFQPQTLSLRLFVEGFGQQLVSVSVFSPKFCPRTILGGGLAAAGPHSQPLTRGLTPKPSF